MDASLEMQKAEGEIRTALDGPYFSSAMTDLFKSYTQKSDAEKNAFVAVLIGRAVVSEGLRRARAT